MGTAREMSSVQDRPGLQQACLTNVKDRRIERLGSASCQFVLLKFWVKLNHKNQPTGTVHSNVSPTGE